MVRLVRSEAQAVAKVMTPKKNTDPMITLRRPMRSAIGPPQNAPVARPKRPATIAGPSASRVTFHAGTRDGTI